MYSHTCIHDELQAVLINGQLGGPLIQAAPDDVLKVNVINDLSGPYTGDFGEISLHWHGFDMKGVPYLDGTGYMSQCPIEKNSSMEYEFIVKEEPGTYMYHEHTSVLVADGLAGGLYVTGGDDAAINAEYGIQEENNIFIVLSEWFNETGPSLAKRLNGRVPTGGEQEETQNPFQWVGTPRSLLMNYQGCYMDCTGGSNRVSNATCKPDPECATRYSLTVEPETSYRIRLIGAGSLLFQIVCFEGHNLTLVATDARTIDPLEIGECVDVNLGQRMDVILKTMGRSDSLEQKNQTAFWITGRASGRDGMPASYGVLRYRDAKDLPPSDPPQPADVPESWSSSDFVRNITSPKKLVPNYVRSAEPGKTVFLEVAQPILQQTSQIRWAISNVAFLETPTCNSTLAQTKDPDWLTPANPYLIETADDIARINITDIPGLGQQAGSGEAFVYLNLNYDKSLMPKEPVAGTPLVETHKGDIVDVLVQNNPPEAFGGIILNRTCCSEEHPIHLHGHHFWILGSGQGNFVDLEKNSSVSQLLNYENPQMADTATLPKDGWLYLRFKANNPGVWPIHCHIAWHEFMGQLMLFAEDVENIPETPDGILPECKKECVYNAAPYAFGSETANQSQNESSPEPAGVPAQPDDQASAAAPASSARGIMHTTALQMIVLVSSLQGVSLLCSLWHV